MSAAIADRGAFIRRMMDFVKKDVSHLSVVYAMTGLQDHESVEKTAAGITRGKIVDYMLRHLDEEEPYQQFKTLVEAYMNTQ